MRQMSRYLNAVTGFDSRASPYRGDQASAATIGSTPRQLSGNRSATGQELMCF